MEIIVDVAFGAIPSILGIGAAGLLGSGIINTAKEVRNSISLLKTVGPMMEMGWMVGGRLNTLRRRIAERGLQSDKWLFRNSIIFIAPIQWTKSKLKKNNQDTQGKQDEKGGGGGSGSPPVPPDIKSEDKKEERPKPTGIDTYSPISIPNPFKKKE